MNDPFNLTRFIDAQAPVYAQVITELRAGRKRSHWMWFIFPQLRELGRSSTAQFYGITSRAEAQAYLGDATLGPRLLECSRLVCSAPGRSVDRLMRPVDALKLRSSMTLFESAARDANQDYAAVLDRWFDGQRDQSTIELIAKC